MNKAILIGRTTADIELKYTASTTAVCNFTLAVNRRFKAEDGSKKTDFINCVAWNKTAEILSQYVKKGNQLAIEGRIETRTYQAKDGSTRYVTEILVETFDFIGSKNDTNTQEYSREQEVTPYDFNKNENTQPDINTNTMAQEIEKTKQLDDPLFGDETNVFEETKNDKSLDDIINNF